MVRADFDRNLKGLQEDLLALGTLVERAIAKSMDALKNHDLEASREVVAEDDLIDRKRINLEDECIDLIATQQPIAIDLRTLMAVMHISVELERDCSPEDAAETFAGFRGEPQERGLPSAPRRPIHVLRSPDRPQPALDREREKGMAVSVGGIEPCPILGLRFEGLVHNTVRGAAGAAILNAELLHARGLLPG